jgi:hypothetical protein
MHPDVLAQIAETQTGRSDANSQPGKVPIDMVDADQLPRETALKYEELCLLVGSLYIDSHHKVTTMQEQFGAIKAQLEHKLRELARENQALREQLNGHTQPQDASA